MVPGVDYIEEDRGHETPCHIWQHGLDAHGYGSKWVGGKILKAHRIAYVEAHGAVPPMLDHKCSVRECVRVDHLQPTTNAENVRRGRGTKLTYEAVEQIKAARRTSPPTTLRELAERFGVSKAQISRVASGQRWAAK